METNQIIYKYTMFNLQSLLTRPDICNGVEMKQFLGYSGDGHIAFVRKMSESTGPRIDQVGYLKTKQYLSCFRHRKA